MTAAWWSQRFAPDGSAASEGIRRQLGVPKLDPLAVLVREAAQNSWDARQGGKPVEFRIKLDQPSPAERESWCRNLLPEPVGPGALGIAECLQGPSLTMLTISDRNTTGLGGPLRADVASVNGTDFVNLVRNVGEPRDKIMGGGTYGFGKGVLFTASGVGVVLIHTRCLWQGSVQSRLIGVALGHSYSASGVRYTGRHWWGAIGNDDLPDPLLDEAAEELAVELRLPSFADDTLGTDVVVIGADLGLTASTNDDTDFITRDIDNAADYLASAMVWNLWPLLLPSEGGAPRMICRVEANGHEIPVPAPAAVPRLWPFVEAFRSLDRGRGSTILRRKPSEIEVGRFAASNAVAPVRRDRRDLAAPFDGPAHHCALMRQAGLIVTYLEGPTPADEGQQYGAVFMSLPAVDDVFASAEPPTHDDWVTYSLADEGRRTVDAALRSVQARMIRLADETDGSSQAAARQPPLGQLSERLAELLPSAAGDGASSAPAARRGVSPRGGARRAQLAWITDGPRLIRDGGRPLIFANVAVADHTGPVVLTATAEVALETGREHEPPLGAGRPRVLDMRTDGRRIAGNRVVVWPEDPRRWTVVVEPTPDAMVTLNVRAEPMEAGQ